MDVVDHLPGTHSPVVLGVGGAPLLGSVQAEDDVVLRLVAGLHHGVGHGQHQAHGAVVVLEALEVNVIVAAHQNLMVGGLALEHARNIIGGTGVDLHLVVHLHGGADGAGLQLLLNLFRVGYADGQGGDAHRAADVLAVERIVGDLCKAANVGRQHAHCALVHGLQHGVGDPPVVALVDVQQDDLAGHVQALIVLPGPLVHIHDLGGQALGGGGCGGVGIDVVVLAVDGQAGAVELPAVALGGLLLHVGQADVLHHADQVIGGGMLGITAGVAAALLGVEILRVGGQLQGDVVGIGRLGRVQIALVALRQRRGRDGIIGGGLLPAGRQGKHQGQKQQQGQGLFQSLFLLNSCWVDRDIWIYKNAGDMWETYHLRDPT